MTAMHRTRVRHGRIVAVLLAATVGGVWAGSTAAAFGEGSEPVPISIRRYVVRPGDTLWSIAGRVDPSSDPRPVVDAIMRANGVDAGALVPGQTLQIPDVG